MSTTQCVKTLTMPAEGNLKDKLYHALTVNSSGRVEEANAATETVEFILAVDPGDTADGDPVTVIDVQAGGIGLMKAQAAITRGHVVHPTTTAGKVAGVAATSNLADNVQGCGRALEAASAADEIIRVKLGVYGPPTT